MGVQPRPALTEWGGRGKVTPTSAPTSRLLGLTRLLHWKVKQKTQAGHGHSPQRLRGLPSMRRNLERQLGQSSRLMWEAATEL